MQKQKQYDWKDSNLAMFGSDVEKQVKKESAETEPAWQGVGEELGLRIWRIEKFQVKPWPKEDYGKFYDGDSYIILNTYKEEGQDDIKYDVHFWIGRDSSQDEYGTAAYKTVELDTFLDDKPIQHREVMNHESNLFKSYFKKIELLRGGVDSGFRHVKTREYQPRLLHFSTGDGKHVQIREVGMSKHNLDDSDVFILDSESKIFQYNGPTANQKEKFSVMQYVSDLKGKRSGVELVVLDGEKPEEFLSLLNDDPRDTDPNVESHEKLLFKLSDETGELKFSKVAEGELLQSMIDDNDVFIADIGTRLLVYTGSGCSTCEKKNAMAYAHKYLMKTEHPLIPVAVVNNRNNKDFKAFFPN